MGGKNPQQDFYGPPHARTRGAHIHTRRDNTLHSLVNHNVGTTGEGRSEKRVRRLFA